MVDLPTMNGSTTRIYREEGGAHEEGVHMSKGQDDEGTGSSQKSLVTTDVSYLHDSANFLKFKDL